MKSFYDAIKFDKGRIKVGWRRLAKSYMDLFFPPVCPVCYCRLTAKKREQTRRYEICDVCSSQIRFLVRPLCRVCGIELYGAGDYQPLCGDCLLQSLPYALARSVVYYGEEVRQLVHKLKYAGDMSVLPGIGQLIHSCNMEEFADIDCVVVVPLHRMRLRERGFNQAALLARLFFKTRENCIHADWLLRTRNTVPQTLLDRKTRRKNLQGAFKARSKNCFEGATVCLVDDVFTTGTTVRECSKVIMENRAKAVKVLTLARVIPPSRSGRL